MTCKSLKLYFYISCFLFVCVFFSLFFSFVFIFVFSFFFFIFLNRRGWLFFFLANVALLSSVRAAVRIQTRSNDIFSQDCFSSMQNLYTFSIIHLASSLYFHFIAILFQSCRYTVIYMEFISHYCVKIKWPKRKKNVIDGVRSRGPPTYW